MTVGTQIVLDEVHMLGQMNKITLQTHMLYVLKGNCQSGRWKSTSHSGKRTFLYLENYSQIDIYCPLGWSEVSLTRIYSGNSLNYRRICSIESAVDVLYLEDSSSQVVPSCPVGFVEYCWTGIMNAGSMVYRRTCLSV